MRDLVAVAGLPLGLEEDGRLVFGQGLDPVAPSFRRFVDLAPVLERPEAAGGGAAYTMYRDLALLPDREMTTRHNLRYDITVLAAGRLGREYVKTLGHDHPLMPGSPLTYGEVYQVLVGRAIFLLQKADEAGSGVEDVMLVTAEAGDTVVIPSGYGHITVNVGEAWLVTANWVDPGFQAVYRPLTERRGGAYYIVDVDGITVAVPNEMYGPMPFGRVVAPRHTWPAGASDRLTGPVYPACVENPALFAGLVRPSSPWVSAASEAAGTPGEGLV